jgi:hypothetical protein
VRYLRSVCRIVVLIEMISFYCFGNRGDAQPSDSERGCFLVKSFKLAQSSLKKGCGSGVLDAVGFALLLNVSVISDQSLPPGVRLKTSKLLSDGLENRAVGFLI